MKHTSEVSSALGVYHGRQHLSKHFHRRFCGSHTAADQEGPGFYFTSDLADAARYGVHVIKADLTNIRWLPDRRLPPTLDERRDEFLLHLLWTHLLPRRARMDAAENWAGDVAKAREAFFMGGSTLHEVLQTVWFDFYRPSRTALFLRHVSAVYQGVRLPRPDGVMHYLIFDPDCIEVCSS